MNEREEFEAAWSEKVANIPNYHWDGIKEMCFDFWQAARSTPMAGAEPPKQGEAAKVCGVCFEEEAFTGTCGGGRKNPRALCFQGAPFPSVEPAQPLEALRSWAGMFELEDDDWRRGYEAARAWVKVQLECAPAPHQEPGWVRVPVVPTHEMLMAGHWADDGAMMPTAIWDSMLNAAPKDGRS